MRLETILKTTIPTLIIGAATYYFFDKFLTNFSVEPNAVIDLVFVKYCGIQNYLINHPQLHNEILKITAASSIGTYVGMPISSFLNKNYK